MKKLLIAGICVVLILLFAGCGKLETTIEGNKMTFYGNSCTDDTGGADIYVKGNLIFDDKKTLATYEDYCVRDTITEYSCSYVECRT